MMYGTTIKELSISNVKIWGLADFQPSDFKINLSEKSGSFKIHIPKIMGFSDFNIDAKVYQFIPMECPKTCRTSLEVLEMGLVIHFTYGISENNTLRVGFSEMKVIPGKTGEKNGAILDIAGLNGSKPGDRLDRYQKTLLTIVTPFLWKQVITAFKIYSI